MTEDISKSPLLALRDTVMFPKTLAPFFVGRPQSVAALKSAIKGNKQVFLLAQKDPETEEPMGSDLYEVGTIGTILQLLFLDDGSLKVLIEGKSRAKVKRLETRKNFPYIHYEVLEDEISSGDDLQSEILSLCRSFEKYVEYEKNISSDVIADIEKLDDMGQICDSIASHLNIKLATRQKILEENSVAKRIRLMHVIMSQEIDLIEVEAQIQGQVKTQVEESQRKYYLSEKKKAIEEQLSLLSDEPLDDLEVLEADIKNAGMPEEALNKALSELDKMKLMPPMSAESTVSRNYLEEMIKYPWDKANIVNDDLEAAEKILDGDHYGLEKVKERILEYLAVHKRVKHLKGPILCLVGPPGVGKTSLGQSIASATGREFTRFSLGGVRDEAEIRGHRRPYIGAMPGKIIQKISKTKTKNPLFMLDEVDKMAMDFRGDPASALLEVLDPEQNDTFNDHYLEVDTDLSDTMFIATSNSMNIPPALLDRMEIIRLAGYTEEEKYHIAKKYLLPRQLQKHGLKTRELGIGKQAILEIIRYYTREAGVRNLERNIAKICRKVVRDIDLGKSGQKKVSINRKNIEEYLGVKKFRFGKADSQNQIGQVTGLAWTEVGGELLTIEVQVVPGKGKNLSTGRLGDVMQESIQAAMTVVRSRAQSMGIDEAQFQSSDFHIHVPEGATPKDGPSAGIGMCVALVSAMTKIPVCADVAMTGEITLRGEVLPIGGLKEKLLAALRGGIKNVLIPKENERDLKEIPENVIKGLNIYPVQWIDEVLDIALTSRPKPVASATDISPSVKKKKRKSKEVRAKH